MTGRDVRRGSLGPYRMPLGAAMPVPDTLAFLRGRWRLERWLDDRRSGVRGTFTGDAEFAATGDPGTLRYDERGDLRFGGHAGPATRSLLCLRRPGGAVDVRFADGREFYRLDLGPGSCQAEHLCGRDRYTLTFRVLSPDLLEERWRVLGPQKAYDSVTALHRLDVSSPA
jgi:hypothetical protein